MLNDLLDFKKFVAPTLIRIVYYIGIVGIVLMTLGMIAGGGLAWMITPRVQLDAGLDRRLGGAAPEWQTNLGVSIYFGR